MAGRRTFTRRADRHVIEYAARECETCLRLAQFAENEFLGSHSIATGLRKLAAYHSGNAFNAAAHLAALEFA